MCRRRRQHRFSAADGIRVEAGATRAAEDVVRDVAMTVAAVVDVAIGVDRVALVARAFSVHDRLVAFLNGKATQSESPQTTVLPIDALTPVR
jgi:hypothetical protein